MPKEVLLKALLARPQVHSQLAQCLQERLTGDLVTQVQRLLSLNVPLTASEVVALLDLVDKELLVLLLSKQALPLVVPLQVRLSEVVALVLVQPQIVRVPQLLASVD